MYLSILENVSLSWKKRKNAKNNALKEHDCLDIITVNV